MRVRFRRDSVLFWWRKALWVGVLVRMVSGCVGSVHCSLADRSVAMKQGSVVECMCPCTWLTSVCGCAPGETMFVSHSPSKLIQRHRLRQKTLEGDMHAVLLAPWTRAASSAPRQYVCPPEAPRAARVCWGLSHAPRSVGRHCGRTHASHVGAVIQSARRCLPHQSRLWSRSVVKPSLIPPFSEEWEVMSSQAEELHGSG